MGTCVSNHEELLNELKKHDNNQIILEHLRQNQENFAALTKSLNQIATLNRSEPNLALAAISSPSRCAHEYQEKPRCSSRKCESSRHQKPPLLLVPRNFIQFSNANPGDTSNETDSPRNETDNQQLPSTYRTLKTKYPESILIDSNLKKQAHHYPQFKHHKYLNNVTSPSRHCKSPHLIIIDNSSSSLSSSCESLHSNKKLYNESQYYEKQQHKHRVRHRSQTRVNDAANYGFFCDKPNCNKCVYAMRLLETRSTNDNSPKAQSRHKYSESNDSRNGQLKKAYRKRSESSSKAASASSTLTKKTVNFLNTTYDDSQENSESLINDEPATTRWNQPKQVTSLAIYDNLSEFNNYLNEKMQARHAKQREKSSLFNVRKNTNEFADQNRLRQSALYSDVGFHSSSREYAVLPIQIDRPVYQQRDDRFKLSNESIIGFIDSKLDLSYSSNDRLQNSTRSVSLETSLNLGSLNQKNDDDSNDKEGNMIEKRDAFSPSTVACDVEDSEDITEVGDTELQVFDKEEDEERAGDEVVTENVTGAEVLNESLERCQKLKIKSIVEAVGFLIFPSSGFINKAFRNLLVENCLFDLFKKTFKKEFQALFDPDQMENHKYSVPADDLINISLVHLLEISSKTEVGTDTRKLLKEFQINIGRQYFKILYDEYKDALLSIGGSLQSFFNNLNSLNESLINHEKFGPRFFKLSQKYTGYLPNFRCDDEILKKVNKKQTYMLKVYTIQQKTTSFMSNFYFGLIESAAKLLMNLDIRVEKFKKTDLTLSFMKFDLINTESNSDLEFMQHILGYKVTLLSETEDHVSSFLTNNAIKCADDLCISIDLFKSTFPFSLLIDRSLDIIQFGDSLLKHLGQSILAGHGNHLFTYFDIELPRLNEYSFESIFINTNMNYRLKMKMVDERNSELEDMEIKGSMIYVEETDCLLFIGSPVLLGLDELTGRGLYISDIPIHDATRDIILVGEQTKAQDGLKTRMEKLQASIQQAYEEIEEEKQKNIELLNLIFPSDIAEKLWNGEEIMCKSVENVTLLYSDIVGFTAICSTAQPIQIVEMLKLLYTEFDYACGLLDIYKLETIGDAYIVAGGLHKKSKYHAQRIAWMSLLMMEAAANNFTHKGDRIKIRIGLHTGDVLAGIVGIKQPRYCLFGNSCNIANKFESSSEERRIHISDTTKRFLDETSGFEMESRGSEFVPDNYVSDSGEMAQSWFLNSYKCKEVAGEEEYTLMNHVKTALENLDEA